VDFKNTVIIMTSNIGSMYLLEGMDEVGELDPKAETMVTDELKRHFRPEFLNRVDDIVFFKPLRKDEVKKIIDIQFEKIAERLKDRNIKLALGENAKAQIIDNAYDPIYGARPIKRYLQKNMETFIGRALIAGEIKDGDSIVIDSVEGKLTFKQG
jgi:ATP-dependent Clp protease ATP-binding subunit ClpB